MDILEYFTSALQCLKINKLRTFLTTLGIIVGISSVILINILGNSLVETIENVVASFSGGISAEISLCDNGDTFKRDSFGQITNLDNLKIKKLDKKILGNLEESFDNKIYRLENYYSGIDGTIISDEGKNRNVSLTYVTPIVKKVSNINMQKGRFINDGDIEKKASVAVISSMNAELCFGDIDPIGKSISFIDNNNELHELVIIGVYNPNLQEEMWLDTLKDSYMNLYVPFTYHQEQESFYNVEYVISDIGNPSLFADEAKAFLDPYYEGETVHIEIETSDEYSSKITSIVNLVSGIVLVIAAISLIVGGIGVMNIMLVSINERTMEIGVRKAMGAENNSIRLQFLIESVMITLLGSGIGILLGIIEAKAIAFIGIKIAESYNFPLSVNLTVSYVFVLIAVLFSILLGVVFGVYPADKAAKMDVVVSLRNE